MGRDASSLCLIPARSLLLRDYTQTNGEMRFPDRICPVSQASHALLKFIPSHAGRNSFSHPIKWPALSLSLAVASACDTLTRFLPVWSEANNRLSHRSVDLPWLLHSAPLKRNSRKLGKVGGAGRGVQYCFILTSFHTTAGITERQSKNVGRTATQIVALEILNYVSNEIFKDVSPQIRSVRVYRPTSG